MFIFILSTICVALFLTKIYIDDLKYTDFYKIKGPKPLPFLGNVLLFGSAPKDMFETVLRLAKEYGDFFRLIMGSVKIIVLSNPDHIQVILGSTKHINKSEIYEFYINWLENGLINSKGDYWRRHRKIITPTFYFKILQDYSTFMAKNLNILIGILKGNTSNIIKINHYIHLYALDTICNSAMRYDLQAQSNVESDYVKALKGYLDILMIRIFSVFLRNPFIFGLSKLGKQQNNYASLRKSLTSEVINSRKSERATIQKPYTIARNEFGVKPRRSFLDLLLDKQDEDNIFTDAEIREEVSSFMFAGHDTVSSSISFCLYELAQHPEVQDKLVEESWAVMGKDKDVEVNSTNISSLNYLDCVVKECMRIYTTVPFIERELDEDVILDGLRIPAGTTVQILIYMLHWNEKYYPEPEKFDPERFSKENTKTRHPYAYIPFSAGPRNCIGFKYGLLLTKATVINILRNFKLSRPQDPKYKPELYNNAVLESKNGINLYLEARI